MKKYFIFVISILCFIFIPAYSLAGPTSNSYELKNYSFGSGGTEGSDSSSYSLFGTIGEIGGNNNSSTTYTFGEGLIYTLLTNTPAAPSLTNPSNYYDRLKIVIDTAGNPSDTLYAIAISDDNWSSIKYLQNDATIWNNLGVEDWLPYSSEGGNTDWNSTLGRLITGLKSNTTYYVKVKARQGSFTESAYSNSASQITSTPSLSFSVSSNTINFDSLNSSNSFTDTTKTSTISASTNARNGYVVYGHTTQLLTSADLESIENYPSTNDAPSVWSGTGFGYSTNDDNLSGGTSNRFTNSGPKYAGFTLSTPGDPVADNANPISNDQFTINYRITTPENLKAGSYYANIIYTAIPTY